MYRTGCYLTLLLSQSTCFRLPLTSGRRTHNCFRFQSILSSYIDISPDLDGGVLKKVIRKGNYANGKPLPRDVVEIGWKMYTHDGTFIHDSDSLDETFDFIIGEDEVIDGWEIAVQDMFEGEIASLQIQPEYAFGEAGAPPLIQPRELINCELTLIRIIPDLARVYKSIGADENIRDELLEKLYDGDKLLLNDPPQSIDFEDSMPNSESQPFENTHKPKGAEVNNENILDSEQNSRQPVEQAPAMKMVSSTDAPWRNSSTTAETKDDDKTRVYFDPAKHKVNPNLAVSGIFPPLPSLCYVHLIAHLRL